jgi:hypothetical protein
MADDVLQSSLLKIRSLCEEQCSSLQHEPAKMLFIREKFGEETMTLEEFVAQSSRQADHVNIELQALRSTCLSVTEDACQVRNYCNVTSWVCCVNIPVFLVHCISQKKNSERAL